jgi:hypothetical protein
MTPSPITENGLCRVEFSQFDLASYDLFLKCKALPESRLDYDPERDTYTLTTDERYAALLGAKARPAKAKTASFNPKIWDYQRFIVSQALDSKRYACYADCGLGKTFIFLEWARHVAGRTDGKVLILSPLQVIEQTREQALDFYGDALPIRRLDTREQLEAWLESSGDFCRSRAWRFPDLAIVNYAKFIPGQLPGLRRLAGLVADESSILKTGGGVIKWNLIKSARGIPYKLSCTATPAPNEIMEYASQAAYLERLRTEEEILWTFFSRDKRGNWRIKPHAHEGFYRFLASWSIYLRNPAHYGFKDNNTEEIPVPEFIEHRIPPTDEQMREASRLWHQWGSGLFGTEALGVKQRAKQSQLAKGFIYEGKTARRVPSEKPAIVAEIAASEMASGRQTLIWTVFDAEEDELRAMLVSRGISAGDVGRVAGSDSEDERLDVIDAFRKGRLPCLISKPALLGFGMNFQNCRAMIFNGWTDSYEQFYQAVRRAHRYGQTDRLRVHIPYIEELEGAILKNVLRKAEGFERDAQLQEHYYRSAMEALRVA